MYIEIWPAIKYQNMNNLNFFKQGRAELEYIINPVDKYQIANICWYFNTSWLINFLLSRIEHGKSFVTPGPILPHAEVHIALIEKGICLKESVVCDDSSCSPFLGQAAFPFITFDRFVCYLLKQESTYQTAYRLAWSQLLLMHNIETIL